MNKLISCALLAVLAALPFSTAHAGTYPDRPVTMLVPFSPGSGSDIAMRLIEKDFQEEFGQPLSFVYKPGADGAIGYSEMATIKPDGYTIGTCSYPHLLLNKLKGAGSYELDSFDLLCVPIRDDVYVVTAKDGGAKTFQEFVDAVKANPDKLTVGTTDALISTHIPALQMKKAGMAYNITTFNGGTKALPALLGGHIDAMFITMANAMTSSDSLNFLAICSDNRDPNYPDVPTLKELGYDITSIIGRGFFAPKGLPEDVRQRLEDGLKNIFSKPDVPARYDPRGMRVVWVDGKGFRKMLDDFQPQAEAAIKLNEELSGK